MVGSVSDALLPLSVFDVASQQLNKTFVYPALFCNLS